MAQTRGDTTGRIFCVRGGGAASGATLFALVAATLVVLGGGGVVRDCSGWSMTTAAHTVVFRARWTYDSLGEGGNAVVVWSARRSGVVGVRRWCGVCTMRFMVVTC